jgi:hypothetical protein
MSIGEGLGNWAMFAAKNISQNKRADKQYKQMLEMFNLKNAAALTNLQKMEEFKYGLTDKRKQQNLDSVTAKYKPKAAIPQSNAAIPSSEPINGNGAVPLPIPSSPAQGQVPQAPAVPLPIPSSPTQGQVPQAPVVPSMESFNSENWEKENYKNYLDENNNIDNKSFRQGLKSAEEDYQKQQYFKSLGIELPVSMTNSPFASDIIKTKQEAKKYEKNKALVISVAKQYGMKLSPEEIEAYASDPSTLQQIQHYKLSEKRFASSEDHRRKMESNAGGRGRGSGGGGRGRGRSSGGSGGTGGYKQTRDGNFVKVDRRGNPTGQIIKAKDAYNMGITNTPPATRQTRPRATQSKGGGGTAELIRQQLNSIKEFN